MKVKGDDLDGKAKDKVPVKRPTKKKPKDKPKRPLSAYNFFFKEEREKILKVVLAEDPSKVQNDPDSDDYLNEATIARLKKEGGKVSFEEMGKIIGQRWKNIDPDRLATYSEMASEDTERYKNEMQTYNGRQEAKMRSEALKPPVSYQSGPPPPVPGPRGHDPYAMPPGQGMDGRGAPMGGGYPDQMGGMSAFGNPGPAPGMGPPSGYGPYGGMDYNGYGGMGMGGYGMGSYGGGYSMGPPPQDMGMRGGMEPPPSNGYGAPGGGYGMGMMGGGYQGGMMGYGGGPPPPEYSNHGGHGPPPPPQHSMEHQHPPPPPHGGMYGGGYGQGY